MKIESELERIVGLLLWHCQAVEVRPQAPFQLASGNYAPLYINCRSLISYPGPRDLVISCAQYLYHEREMNADTVGGGETAGIPFGAWLAQRLEKPFVYVRKQRKAYGTGARVEGIPNGRVLLFEDLITDGGSKLGFVEGIREAGGMVSDCLVIMDREEGGAEALSSLGVRLHSLVRMSICLEIWFQAELISTEALEEVREYLANPRAWHRSRGLPFIESA